MPKRIPPKPDPSEWMIPNPPPGAAKPPPATPSAAAASFGDEGDKRSDLHKFIQSLKLPPEKIGGEANPEYYRVKYRLVNEWAMKSLHDGERLPQGYDSTLRGIEKEAEFAGIDPKRLADRRTEAEKNEDAVRLILDDPDESIFKVADDTLTGLDRMFEMAVNKAQEVIDKYVNKDNPNVEPDALEAAQHRARLGKEWRSRIHRVLRLRELVRHPNPISMMEKGQKICPNRLNAYEAANVLFYMLYTHRANTADHGLVVDGQRTRLLQLGDHHARYAVVLWLAQNGCVVKITGVEKHKTKHDGMLFLVHPGCGKTEAATATVERMICANPSLQAVYLHAAEEQAGYALAYIQNAFSLDNDVGRRREALFPGLSMEEKNKKRMRIKLRQKMKSPTVTASGVTAKSLGANTDLQVFDDVVPQSDRDQEAERTRRKATLSGTWETRQRGNAFRIIIGTIWHKDDYLAWMLDQAKAGKIKYLYCAIPAGGPDDTPKFKSVWPEIYPPEKLRDIYNKMPDRSVYDLAYRIDTSSKDSRLIKTIRYYDPFSAEHDVYMRGGVETYVSCDPSATARVESDRAGVLHLALGECQTQANASQINYETQLRIIDAKSLSINQPDLVQAIIDYGLSRSVGEVHIETVGGFHATADFLEEAVEGIQVVRHQTGNRDKGTRLRMCASLIDNSMPGLPAAVLFPGEKKADGTIGPCEDWQRLYDQILRFDASSRKNKEFADSLSQIVNHLVKSGVLTAGEGEASRLIRKAVEERGDPRIRRILDQAEHGNRNRVPAEVEDANWANRNLN